VQESLKFQPKTFTVTEIRNRFHGHTFLLLILSVKELAHGVGSSGLPFTQGVT